jgi:LuxR family maltose regulon positive regulatory protein
LSIPITRTKIILPRRRSDILTRDRLLELMYELLDYKLVIIAAPAGYGKTSLLVDFAQHAEIPVSWLAIDPLDRDRQRFIGHFIASINQSFPTFGKQSTTHFQSTNEIDLDGLVTTIVNDAYEHIQEHFVLVLDDYHLVNDTKDIDTFINRFIQEVGENCHLILSSRTLLTLPDLPIMVARSLVGGLSFEELAFRPDEIKSLALQNYHLTMPENVAEKLVDETEGWITGLLLSAQTMWQGMEDRLRVARVSGIGLYDYLAQQVLESQSLLVREFLLRSSLLEEFDVELCKAVFGSDGDWSRLLDTVLQHNLFVLPVGEDGRTIRYHHLFRDFLQARLEQEYPEEKVSILNKLASVYASHSDWEKAFLTYQKLGDENASADLIERAGPELLKSGRSSTLSDWLETITDEIVSKRPNLQSLRGSVEVLSGRMEQGLDLLQKASTALQESGNRIDQARTLLRLAVAHRYLGKFEDSLKVATQANDLLEGSREIDSLPLKAEALRAIGVAHSLLSHLDQAIDFLSDSLQAYKLIKDHQNIAMVQMELGITFSAYGRYRQALDNYQKTLTYWRRVQNFSGLASLLNNLGVLYHLLGEYAQAAQVYEEALIHAKTYRIKRVEGYLLGGIGDLYADLGAIDQSFNAYGRAMEIASKTDDRFLLLHLNLAEEALARLSGNLTQARQYLKTAEQYAKDSKSSYELGSWQREAGLLALASKKYQIAWDYLNAAVNYFKYGELMVEASRSLLYLAATSNSTGDPAACKNELMEAFQVASTLESQHVLVIPGLAAKQLLAKAAHDPELQEKCDDLLYYIAEFEKNLPSLRRRLRPHTTTVPFAPPKLTIRALGQATVELDGQPINAAEWQNQRRVREFFFYLLVHPEGLSKEALGLIFWPESSPAQLKLKFKNTIYRLRFALGQDVILFDGERYWFNRSLDYKFDVEALQEAMEKARGTDQIDKKVSFYKEIERNYQGQFLPEVEGIWVLPLRERFWQIYVEALLNLAHFYLERGNYNETLDYCNHILSKDSCMEEAHRLAMRAYAAKGNRAAVTRQFKLCRQALLEEINAQPSPQTETLYEALKH